MEHHILLVCRHCGTGFSGYSVRTKFCSPICMMVYNTAPPDANGCWMWVGAKSSAGYGTAAINGKREGAHVRAYRMSNGPIPQGLIVRHKCHHPLCVNPRHLAIGTHADNVQDKVDAGRQARGSQSGTALLTEEQVIEIRLDSRPSHLVAPEYGVAARTIRAVRSGQNWDWFNPHA